MPNDDPSRRSLLKWLDLIHLRPGMYLGVSAPDFGGMLDRLEGLVLGYQLAIHEYQLRDPGVELYSEFSRYLETRLGTGMALGLVIPAIRRANPTDAQAWEALWSLLAEFRNARPG
jgi:hypothetical protein